MDNNYIAVFVKKITKNIYSRVLFNYLQADTENTENLLTWQITSDKNTSTQIISGCIVTGVIFGDAVFQVLGRKRVGRTPPQRGRTFFDGKIHNNNSGLSYSTK